MIGNEREKILTISTWDLVVSKELTFSLNSYIHQSQSQVGRVSTIIMAILPRNIDISRGDVMTMAMTMMTPVKYLDSLPYIRSSSTLIPTYHHNIYQHYGDYLKSPNCTTDMLIGRQTGT